MPHLLQAVQSTTHANAYAERFVRSIKDECLAKVIPFGERHLRHTLAEFVAHNHRERNHQGFGNELIDSGVLLSGFAVETMIKAAAMQASINKDGPESVVVDGFEIKPKFTDPNNVEELARLAGLDLDDTESAQLRRLKKFVVWAGTYPVRKRPVEHEEVPENVDYTIANFERDFFHRLYRLAETAYQRHAAQARERGTE